MSSTSIAPSLIVSVPQMQDPNFVRSVILLVESNDDGAFGLVLNRVSPITVSDICQERNLACDRDDYLRIGGPVDQERAWILHGGGVRSEHSIEVIDGLWLAATWEALEGLADTDEIFRVFLGYAGWGPQQLEREVTEGTWLIGSLDTEMMLALIHEEGDEMWRKAIRSMGLEPGHIGPGGGVH